MILRKLINLKNKDKYYIFNKPYNVLTQFSQEVDKKTLSDYLKLPKDVYPVGRLDYNSEGLLILTNDNFLKTELLNPQNKKKKKYLVQVEGIPKDEELNLIANGVEINVGGKIHLTEKSSVTILQVQPLIEERSEPIRFRLNKPTTWLEIIISEGKNRQVRKMTAKIGYPVLRLIRIAIEDLELNDLKSGEIKEISGNSIYKKINLKKY